MGENVGENVGSAVLEDLEPPPQSSSHPRFQRPAETVSELLKSAKAAIGTDEKIFIIDVQISVMLLCSVNRSMRDCREFNQRHQTSYLFDPPPT